MQTRPHASWDTIPEMVLSTADRFGDAEAIVDGDLRITFEKLTDKVRTAAGAYIEAGARLGDRVAIWAPNSAEWIIAAFGLLTAGGVLVPVNTRFKAAEADDIIRRSQAKLLLVRKTFLASISILATEKPIYRSLTSSGISSPAAPRPSAR